MLNKKLFYIYAHNFFHSYYFCKLKKYYYIKNKA